MRDVPDCLNRRYRALDELIQELSSVSPQRSEAGHQPTMYESNNDPGIKLMCEFWNILKEDPDCNLTQQVKQRMGLTSTNSAYHPQRVTCYMAGKTNRPNNNEDDKRREAMNKLKNMCCKNSSSKDKLCKPPSPSSSACSSLPLSQVLCNLKEAASFDKQCNSKITELMGTQGHLMDQIQRLEQREKEGVKMLKEADCMWSCMEEAYKKSVAESLERQKTLIKQLKEVEASNTKWRKNKKDLDSQMSVITSCQQEITDKINQKNNDIKCMDMEISDLKNRIESNKKDTELAKASLSYKKQASDKKIANIAADMAKVQKNLNEEYKIKCNKERDGTKYVKEGREDLQKICRVLLQKKMENEDLIAEKEALMHEISLINQAMDHCRDRCKNKKESVNVEIKKIEQEIAEFKVKCLRCHQCTDTVDIRKFCTDCPRCLQERDCLIEDDHCSPDNNLDCVCMSVKHKFLDNVFDNMYTVLERKAKTCPGKAVAEAVMACLRRSRNGKLNDETRKILQDFILNTVKKNLNLTIIGGAVKTRCEMDGDTYKQLMLCLKQVTAEKAPKADKGTAAKKESCRRWGGTSECNCPSGPKGCVCTKKAPPPPKDPTPCPPNADDEEANEPAACPHKEATSCGPDCALHGVPSAVGTDVAKWRPDPCTTSACPFPKSMRAAQCVLGPEPLNTLPKSFRSSVPIVPDVPILADLITCRCGKDAKKPCTCKKDDRSQPRERIIEEVMGKYVEVSTIEKVTSSNEHETGLRNTVDKGCNCSTANTIRLIKLSSNASGRHFQTLKGSTEFILLEGTDALIEMLQKKHGTHICKNIDCRNTSHAKELIALFPNSEPNTKLGDTDTRFTVILHPKFKPHNAKKEEVSSASTSHLNAGTSTCHESTSNVVKSNNSSSATLFERNICDTLKDLMNDVIVTDSNDNYGSEVEWMTVASLIQKLSAFPRTSRDNDSNITYEEVEVTNETYEKFKNSKKDDITSDVETLLNDVIFKEVTQSPIDLIFKDSQDSVRTAKREQDINEILNPPMNACNENASIQNLLSGSRILIETNETETSGNCLKCFFQTINRKNEYLNEKKYRYLESKPAYSAKNNKIKTKSKVKPVNLHSYLKNKLAETSAYDFDNNFIFLPEIKTKKSPKTKTRHSWKTK